MLGERIRDLRQAQGRSLADIAGKAQVSVATLSRIENDKQAVDLGLFLVLAKVLQVGATELLGQTGEQDEDVDPLARRIAMLETKKRTELWRDVVAERRSQRRGSRVTKTPDLGLQVEELIAQLDFVRDELETVRMRIKKR
jgi:transcriptional regulator with XRE-family HTH domain